MITCRRVFLKILGATLFVGPALGIRRRQETTRASDLGPDPLLDVVTAVQVLVALEIGDEDAWRGDSGRGYKVGPVYSHPDPDHGGWCIPVTLECWPAIDGPHGVVDQITFTRTEAACLLDRYSPKTTKRLVRKAAHRHAIAVRERLRKAKEAAWDAFRTKQGLEYNGEPIYFLDTLGFDQIQGP